MYDKNTLLMIEELSNAPGTSGFEDEVISVAKKYMEPYAQIEEDKLRNLYIYRNKNTGDKPLVMLDAHTDEVGFMVHSIRPNGTLRAVSIGGWNRSILPSSKVLVRNSEGKYIEGVFAAKPGHFATAADKQHGDIPMSELSIDIGAVDRTDAIDNYKIRIGEPIVPATRFTFDENHGIMFGKAFDDRLGCAALFEIMKKLDGIELPCDVVGVLSSQEEVGERGCKVSARHVKPDVAICIEGTPADDTFTESYAIQTALKKGPMFRHMDVSIICSPRFQRMVLTIAEKTGLKVQEAVREGGGNDACIINTELDGIPVVTAGIPVRYIHSMHGIAAFEDFESTVELVIEVLKNLTKEQIDRF